MPPKSEETPHLVVLPTNLLFDVIQLQILFYISLSLSKAGCNRLIDSLMLCWKSAV